jgi:hypothetical protein
MQIKKLKLIPWNFLGISSQRKKKRERERERESERKS